MKQPYQSPEVLKWSINLQDILTTSNELEPDVTTPPGDNELEPDVMT